MRYNACSMFAAFMYQTFTLARHHGHANLFGTHGHVVLAPLSRALPHRRRLLSQLACL